MYVLRRRALLAGYEMAQPILDHPALSGAACRVRVMPHDGESALVASVDIAAGGAVLVLDGELFEAPSRFSVQVGPAQHLDVPLAQRADLDASRYVWRFLNHSCAPNAILHGRTLVAQRTIRAGEPVTFDYELNEWQMATPFQCRCGAEACRGVIRGFRFLGAAQRASLGTLVAPHVLLQSMSEQD